jgi:L-glyceraldehyde 3-phosphate reductase
MADAYVPDPNRYDRMTYRRCGRSGLHLPLLSLGFWWNFGDDRPLRPSAPSSGRAFDLGITHFDLANNYGPPYGSAERNLGRILREDFRGLRDELVISTKAGWDMWKGPYGDLGSRKTCSASLDQSLQRLGLDHVDVYYHHRPDPRTPLEESMGALHTACSRARRCTSASPRTATRARPRRCGSCASSGTPLLIHQPSVLDAQPLDRGRAARRARARGRRLHRLHRAGAGAAHRQVPRRVPAGQPDGRYYSLDEELLSRGQPSRAARAERDRAARGQTLAQMALAWACATIG